MRIGVHPGVRPKEWRRGVGGLPTPLVVLCAGGMCSPVLLHPAAQKCQLGFWSFCVLFIICPNLHAHSCFWSLIVFLHFVARKDICLGASNAARSARCQFVSVLKKRTNIKKQKDRSRLMFTSKLYVLKQNTAVCFHQGTLVFPASFQ